MSGVKHTPGPWFEQTGFADDVEITADSRQGMVAICAMDLDFAGHIGVEQEANARLIAAAPDLLAVAIKSHKPYEGLSEDDIRSLYGAEEAELAMSLRAAITRATGYRPENGGAL